LVDDSAVIQKLYELPPISVLVVTSAFGRFFPRAIYRNHQEPRLLIPLGEEV
jgi:hypothetical protein